MAGDSRVTRVDLPNGAACSRIAEGRDGCDGSLLVGNRRSWRPRAELNGGTRFWRPNESGVFQDLSYKTALNQVAADQGLTAVSYNAPKPVLPLPGVGVMSDSPQ
jgi:hypothetical protein